MTSRLGIADDDMNNSTKQTHIMPHEIERSSGANRESRAERARRYLTGGGVTREDSDDELGLDDLPWEWTYPNNTDHVGESTNNSAEEFGGFKLHPVSRKRKKSHGVSRNSPKDITGAKMGDFECKVGDCVLLKADGTNEAWVGLICEFMEDEDGAKLANFMWFSTEKEIRNKEKKRKDFMQNELYITPSWDLNPLASINGKATITSAEAYLAKHPTGKIPRNSKGFGKTFICRRGCNSRTATYTDEFIWEDIYCGSDRDIANLIERVQSGTKATRKKNTSERLDDKTDELVAKDEQEIMLRTPRKKRKASSQSMPRENRTPTKVLTPSHKRITVKKALEFTPLGTRVLSPGHTLSSPFQIARSKLHVSAVPAALPCRENEFAKVYSNLESAISEGSGACIYISGTPGTGKTATVREVVTQLNAAVIKEELDDFIFVEINGMKVTDPHQSYSLLWEALKGDRVSPSQALDLLEREFSYPSPRRVPCVVLMDELDQLVTRNQSVMYNFFNWPGFRHSRLIVLAVANTMDLPERTLSNKISSRLGLTRITFAGYNHEQLMRIIQSRLEGVPGGIVESDAVQFASRKVAAVSGDARRALDICRRAVELAEVENLRSEFLPPTPSKKPGQDLAARRPPVSTGRVTIATIKKAINEATTSPLQQHLRGLPLSSKLLLAALLATVRRTGIQESLLGEITDEAKRIVSMTVSSDALQFLFLDILHDATGGKARIGNLGHKPSRAYALGAAAIELMDAGVVGLEARKGDRAGRIRLCISEEDVKQAFKEDPEAEDLGFCS